MNSKQLHTISSGGHLTLPKPDPDNITVLTRNLPNKPILPWNHYDSPWEDAQVENLDELESASEGNEPHDNQLIATAEQQEETPIAELSDYASPNPRK